MTHALKVIPNGVRDLTIVAWISLRKLRDLMNVRGPSLRSG
jgi:hypothetical protein